MADLTVVEGDAVVVEHETTNRGDATDTQGIILDVGGTQEDSETRTLDPDAVAFGILKWVTESGDAGTYTVTVSTDDGETTRQVEVTT